MRAVAQWIEQQVSNLPGGGSNPLGRNVPILSVCPREYPRHNGRVRTRGLLNFGLTPSGVTSC